MKELVSVKWLDAHGTSITAYAEHEIPHAAYEVTTYGLLLREDDSGVSVAAEVCSDNTYRGVTFIPKGMIVEVHRLSGAKRKQKKANTSVFAPLLAPAA